MATHQAYHYKHPHPAVAVDLVIFTLKEVKLQVLLIERGLEPFRGSWALPGGFMRINEDLEEAALRELREETSLSQCYLEQIGAFGAPDRDPRERVVSIAYFAILSADKVALQAGSDARRVRWCSWSELPNLAFDHRQILDAARGKLLEKMNRTTIALEFLAPEFTLTELQGVFETVQGTPMDKRNFRKWAESLSFIKPTGKMRRGGQHRPAALYRANHKAVLPAPTATLVPTPDAERSADVRAAYRKGFEEAVAALHREFSESEKAVLRAMNDR